MINDEVYSFKQGTVPLLISVPHAGIKLTAQAKEQLNETGLVLADTDWYVDRLAKKLEPLGASLIIGQYSRYLIDLNRSSDDKPLYKGATTGLYPEIQFDGRAIWKSGRDSKADQDYLKDIWQPYHSQIKAELDRLKNENGYALLFDLHSIKSDIPRLFEGELPELNIGTNSGNSCNPEIQNRIGKICEQIDDYSHVINGRFKGGFITRQYGQPENDCHAVQLEMAQRTYMSEGVPFIYNEQKAEKLMAVVSKIVASMLGWAKENYS